MSLPHLATNPELRFVKIDGHGLVVAKRLKPKTRHAYEIWDSGNLLGEVRKHNSRHWDSFAPVRAGSGTEGLKMLTGEVNCNRQRAIERLVIHTKSSTETTQHPRPS
jgi:hypothetical protein